MKFRSDDRGTVEFYCDINQVLLLVRYPRYMHTAKSLYGDLGELIIEEILANGRLTFSQCVQKVFPLAESLSNF